MPVIIEEDEEETESAGAENIMNLQSYHIDSSSMIIATQNYDVENDNDTFNEIVGMENCD